MVNKLRTFSWTGGVFLLLLSIWTAVRYSDGAGELWQFFWPIVLGLFVITAPAALAHAKLSMRKANDLLRNRRSSSVEGGSIFVSDVAAHDPSASLATIEDAIRATDEYDRVRREQFPEGEGLTITYAGFHSSFVRVIGSGRIVVTGASEKTRSLARFVERVCGMTFTNTASNPFHRPRSVRGGSRVFLGLLLFIVVLAGVGGVADTAYPSDAYNPAEKVVLVSIDLHADVDPSISTTETKLTKAAFLVDVLSEESVEIRWEQNSSERIMTHGQQALLISEDINTLLAAVRQSTPTPEQAARSDRIERDLHDAEHAVARAIRDRLSEDTIHGNRDELVRISETLATTDSDHDNRRASRSRFHGTSITSLGEPVIDLFFLPEFEQHSLDQQVPRLIETLDASGEIVEVREPALTAGGDGRVPALGIKPGQ